MEDFFAKFREGIIGIDRMIPTPSGLKPIVYADWTASGRCYAPIEKRIAEDIMPMVANTHTETSATGMAMTFAYQRAREIIKKHVNAGPGDLIITCSSGMTGAVNKFQRILGLKLHERFQERIKLEPEERPVVFVTHMEHHSNQTSWLETVAEVRVIAPTIDGSVDLENLKSLLHEYRNRPLKIASVTSCSNVTGIFTPYHEIAKIMHRHKGLCFVDFACSAPYVDINMHPAEEGAHLDAIFFSPHKFLGGPGSTGVLVFNSQLYKNTVPDKTGGGTVDWTTPWGQRVFVKDIEMREDGGTPAFLQTIKAAMCITLKEEMGPANILKREHEMLEMLWNELATIPNLHILADQRKKDRLAIISFYIDDLHHNLGVKMLNDRFGIQCRGGCSCAGTYAHYLFDVSEEQSREITNAVDLGNFSAKPGWIRISLHPTLTNQEIQFIADSVKQLAANHTLWGTDYDRDFNCGDINGSAGKADQEIKTDVENCLVAPFVSERGEKKLVLN